MRIHEIMYKIEKYQKLHIQKYFFEIDLKCPVRTRNKNRFMDFLDFPVCPHPKNPISHLNPDFFLVRWPIRILISLKVRSSISKNRE